MMFAILLLAASARAAIVSVTPLADAFITTGPSGNLSPNNYGGAGALAISGSSASKGIFDAVIRFDLSSVKSSFDKTYGGGWAVQSITLKLFATSPNNATFNAQSSGLFSIVWMQDDNWIEGSGSPNAPGATGITYASLPSFLGADDQALGTFAFDASAAGGDGVASSFSLSLAGGILSDIQAGSLASIELFAATDAVSYLFNSSNFQMASRRPVLTIVAVSEPGASLLLCAAGAFIALMRNALRRKENGDCRSLSNLKYNGS